MSDETFAGVEATGDTLHPGPAREYGRYRYAEGNREGNAEGDAIGGRFAVHRRLRGGFGDVYLCYDRAQDYFYALKTLSLKLVLIRYCGHMVKREAAAAPPVP